MGAEGDTTDGYRFTSLVDTTAERLANFADHVFAVCAGASGFAADIFHALSLVLPDDLPRLAWRAHVLRNRRLSSLFFASRVQDHPRISVCDCVHGHELRAKGSFVVGGAPPP